eukprot:GHVS01059859.1.p1 GENE.GHVS01059859.1~~GHVS01059859.1.p1  ORF type:complete len:202 (+),score=12.94 GHVS01059859.1:592-1197(+)
MAGGTGDIAFRIMDKAHQKIPPLANFSLKPQYRMPKVIVCDINDEMLKVGQSRAKEPQRCFNEKDISWVRGDGEDLPFESNSVDIVTVAFGIRNFTDIEKGLSEAYRVLKPGGRFLCLEFSKVENTFLSTAYDCFSFNLIPLMGQLVANDRSSYQYLVESIRKFPDQLTFSSMLVKAGFECVTFSNLTGGIVAIHSGFRLP